MVDDGLSFEEVNWKPNEIQTRTPDVDAEGNPLPRGWTRFTEQLFDYERNLWLGMLHGPAPRPRLDVSGIYGCPVTPPAMLDGMQTPMEAALDLVDAIDRYVKGEPT